MRIIKKEAEDQYNNMLDELCPLEGIACNPFSILLEKGDPTAYDCGFAEFCNAKDYELD